MPTAAATRLTASHRAQLGLLARLVERRLGVTLRSFDPADVDAWWERVAPGLQGIVAQGHRASAQLAARYVAQFAALERAGSVEPVLAEVVAERVETSLRVTGPVAYRRHLALSGSEQAAQRVMVLALSGSARRLVLVGARDTTAETIDRSSRFSGFQRVTSGSPCAFCAMLASRGPVYKSEASAGGDRKFHDRCSCSVMPLVGRDGPTPQNQRWNELWRDAKARAAAEDVRPDVMFRRLVEGRA